MSEGKSGELPTLEELLNNLLSELMLLALLSSEPMYQWDLVDAVRNKSGGLLRVQLPLAALCRLVALGYVAELHCDTAHRDGYLQNLYAITEAGRTYLRTQYLACSRLWEQAKAFLPNGESKPGSV